MAIHFVNIEFRGLYKYTYFMDYYYLFLMKEFNTLH